MAVMMFGNFFAAKMFLQALASTLYFKRTNDSDDEEESSSNKSPSNKKDDPFEFEQEGGHHGVGQTIDDRSSGDETIKIRDSLTKLNRESIELDLLPDEA